MYYFFKFDLNYLYFNNIMEKLIKYLDNRFDILEEKINKINKIINIDNNINNNNIDKLSIDTIINENNEDIDDLDYDKYDHIIFTDGACNKKEIDGVKPCGFGVYIDKSNIHNLHKIKLYRKMNNVEFTYNNKKEEYKVTNIRAEAYAILYTLIIYKTTLIDKKEFTKQNLNEYELIYSDNIEICSKKLKQKNILIITDSEFWIKVITSWSKKWYIKKIIHEKKNIDLVLYILYYYNLLLNNSINIEFQHVKSHAEKKKEKYYSYAEYGNIEADKLAVLSKSLKNYDFVIGN